MNTLMLNSIHKLKRLSTKQMHLQWSLNSYELILEALSYILAGGLAIPLSQPNPKNHAGRAMVVVGFPWPAKPSHHLEPRKTTALLLMFEARVYQKVAKHDPLKHLVVLGWRVPFWLDWLAGDMFIVIWIDIAATNSPWPAAACSFEASKPAEYERQQHVYVLKQSDLKKEN